MGVAGAVGKEMIVLDQMYLSVHGRKSKHFIMCILRQMQSWYQTHILLEFVWGLDLPPSLVFVVLEHTMEFTPVKFMSPTHPPANARVSLYIAKQAGVHAPATRDSDVRL